MKFPMTRTVLSALAGLVTAATASAATPTTYLLTITNGSSTPISPPLVYVTSNQAGHAQVGQQATPGFVELCLKGLTALRTQELKMQSEVSSVAMPPSAVVMPGSSVSIEVVVRNPMTEAIRFETMYGKSKDVCGTGGIGSHTLYALRSHVTTEHVSKDDVVTTGAFASPALPAGMSGAYACPNSTSAVACIRELSAARMPTGTISFFTPYLPSVVSAIEEKFGADDTKSVLFPASGALQIKLKLKH